MEHKQIFLTFEREFLDVVKERCALKEKRSITSLLRKLFADLPLDGQMLGQLSERLRREQDEQQAPTDPVNVAVRFPEAEYWEARAKASLAWMTVKEFSTELLRLWVRGELDEWLNQIRAEQQTELRHVG